MTRVSPARALRPVLALFAALVVIPSESRSTTEFSAFEVGVATREAGHLRGLIEKLAKENVLYQLRLGGVTKKEMQDTAAQIDTVISNLENGSPAYSVAAPMSDEIRQQLRVLDGRWGMLRRVALASPYDYLRFANELLPKRSPKGDPLRIRGFNDSAQNVIADADKLMRLYKVECDKAGSQFCDASTQSGFFNMRIERIAKELVLMHAGLEPEEHRKDLQKNRDQLDQGLVALAKNPILTQAMDPSRGKPARFVSGLWESVNNGWGRLRFDADLAVEGRIDGLDIPKMLQAQRALVNDLDRIRGALSRYAQSQMEG